MEDQVTINVPNIYEQQTEYYWSYYSYGEEIYYYEDILQYSSSSIYFDFFLTARDWTSYYYDSEEYDYSYTFKIIVSKPTTLVFSCEQEVFNIDFEPATSLTYIRTIPLDAFINSCSSTNNIDITVVEDGTTVFEDTFKYEVNKEIDFDSLSLYSLTSYDYTNFLYIFLIGVVLLFGLVMGYRVYYNYRINKSFLNQDKKTFYLADIWVVFVLSTVVIVILIFSAIFISRERYQNTHFEQVYSTVLDYVPLDLDEETFDITGLNVHINTEDDITFIGDNNRPLSIEVFSISDESFRGEVDVIIEELSSYLVCNIDRQYGCYEELGDDSFVFVIQDQGKDYLLHFLIDETGETIESITLTDKDNNVYIKVGADHFEDECKEILADIRALVIE
jgi:hypothetical protein